LGGEKLGISFNSSSQMEPEFTTAAIVIHHECAKY
jgi:cobalamin-dependent methionine synthase I